MERLGGFVRWLFGVVLILHGLAHTPGVLNAWKISDFEDVSFQPNVWLTDASDTMVALLGAIWLLAAILFVSAGMALIVKKRGWLRIAGLATMVSLVPCLLWREDAVIGLVLNAALIVTFLVVEAWRVMRADHRGIGHGLPSGA